MTALTFQYFLPLIVGVSVYLALRDWFRNSNGLSNSLSRAQKLLTIWTAISATLTLTLFLGQTYQLTATSLSSLLLTCGALFAGLLLPALVLYRYSRLQVAKGEWTDHGHMTIDDLEALELEQDSGQATNNPWQPQAFDQLAYDNAFHKAYSTTVENLKSIESPALSTGHAIGGSGALAASRSGRQAPHMGGHQLKPIVLDTELNFLYQARKLAREQYNLRRTAEKNLLVTRAALAKLESESRAIESNKTDEKIASEQRLQEKIRETSKLETALLQEQEYRQAAEDKLLQAKQTVLHAKREVRKHMEARSKALATARKAVSFSKRSINARAQAEQQIQQLKEQLKNQSSTASSLIVALENEKKNKEQTAGRLAAKMILEHNKKNQSSLSDSKLKNASLLKNRLIKKIAEPKKSINADSEKSEGADNDLQAVLNQVSATEQPSKS